MIKSVLIIIFFMIIPYYINSQLNLVPNGDFEDYIQCPDDFGQVNLAFPWYNPNFGSSDYYNSCVSAPGLFLDVRVPQNSYGFQYPYNGEGYVGISISPLYGYYEYIAVPLKYTLLKNEDYCISYRISLADSLCTSVNRIGVYFSKDSVFTESYNINETPNVLFSEHIKNQKDWILFEESYVAQGNENYLVIGAFDTTEIEVSHFCNDPLAQSGAYYYIDDVKIQLASESCNSNILTIPNIFTPNNDGVNDSWKLISNLEIQVSIYNRWGNVVYERIGKGINWDGTLRNSELASSGVYYYVVKTKYDIKTGYIHLIR